MNSLSNLRPLPCLKKTGKEIVWFVRVSPNAKTTQIMGLQGIELKVAVNAAPADGAANKELIRFLAKTVKLSKRQIEIRKGHTSRNKQLLIHDVEWEDLQDLLHDALQRIRIA